MRQKNKLRKRAKNLAEQSQHLNLAKFNSHIHNSLNSQTFKTELLKKSDGPKLVAKIQNTTIKTKKKKKATNIKKLQNAAE